MNPVFSFASSLGKDIQRYGGIETGCRIYLKAGNLEMFYENGALRRISCGNHEIVRMIYSAIRDRNWLTISPVIEDEKIMISDDSFSIEYKGIYFSDNIDFSARYVIEGKNTGTIVFRMESEAMGNTEKNRIGFCVLHPVESYAGNQCKILKSDMTAETGIFPVHISPHQPFTDIKKMEWSVNNLICSLAFSGDIFETEDQRNWSDASYKTYCTPLSKPFPVTILKGEHINQQVEFKIQGGTAIEKKDIDTIRLKIDYNSKTDLPLLGIGKSTRPEPLTQNEINILRNLRFDHYRIDLYLFNPDWKYQAAQALKEAEELNYQPEIVLFFDDNANDQAEQIIRFLHEVKVGIAVITIFHKSRSSTPDYLISSLAPLFKKEFPGIRICCGTNANFAQLNRNRPGSDLNDLICYSIHPQEHASDNTTLVENLMGQKYTVESAAEFSGKKGIWISPVTMKRRFNANTGNYEIPSGNNDFPPQADSRMISLFGACWSVGSLKYLCESKASGATYFETAGERGIIQGDFMSRWPEKFQAIKGMIFPVYHIFYFILKYKNHKILKSHSSNSLDIDILSLTDGIRLKIILINFTGNRENVLIEELSSGYSMKQLNTETYSEAASDNYWYEKTGSIKVSGGKEIQLEPFSVNFIE
jgi:hypothetical protein